MGGMHTLGGGLQWYKQWMEWLLMEAWTFSAQCQVSVAVQILNKETKNITSQNECNCNMV